MGVVVEIAAQTWSILADSAVFLLSGFVLAGLIKSFISMERVKENLGGAGAGPVVKASLVGIPLPLCSCSVLPTAMSLRKMGASRGATSSFLISTPETGVDSIAISYALLDPLMTIYRPVAAFFTAMTAGLLEQYLPGGEEEKASATIDNEPVESDCGCEESCEKDQATQIDKTFASKLSSGVHYAFFDLMDDLAWWLILGLLSAGAITTLLPDEFFSAGIMQSNYIAMPVMLLLGVPMYICATSSTPLAAAMIIKGLSPGAALVFLLAGPATNIASVLAIREFMGVRSVVIYLAAISVSAIGLGVGLDYLYQWFEIEPAVVMGQAAKILPPALESAAAIIFSAFALRSVWVTKMKKRFSPAGATIKAQA